MDNVDFELLMSVAADDLRAALFFDDRFFS
jgi:hypothetical protein